MQKATNALTGPAREAVIGIAAGVLVALSLPPFGWWPLGCFGLASVAAALPGLGLARRLVLGAGWGLAQFAIGIAWTEQFSAYGFVVLLIVCAAFTCLSTSIVPTGRDWTVTVGLPASVMLVTWARDRFPLHGFPLAGTELGQAAGPLEWAVKLGGGLLLSGETALVGVGLALVAKAVYRRAKGNSRQSRESPSRTGRDTGARLPALAVVVACALPLAGWLSPSGAGRRLSPLRVALVQGGGPLGTRAINTDPAVVFNRQLSESAGLKRPLNLVVWPEGMLQADTPFQYSAQAGQVAALARRLSATVVAGVVQNLSSTKYLNEAAAWSPAGSVVATYVKNHLVPFGEYIPDRPLLSKYFNVADVPRDAIPGHSPAFMSTPAAPLGVLISYEVFFGARARSGVRAGGQLLVVPTDDASYRGTQVVGQELAAARLRAVETGRWLVLVSPTGYSEVVRPDGVVEKRSSLSVATVLEATVGRRTGRTVFVQLGDKPFVLGASGLWLAATVCGVAGGRIRRSKRSKTPSEGRVSTWRNRRV